MRTTKENIKHEICKILDIADKTYYNWKQTGRPIIGMLESYFDGEELREYLETKKITKLEYLKKAAEIDSNDFKTIAIILDKIEAYIIQNRINREGFLIKIYRTLRDMPNNVDYLAYLRDYDMATFESFKNLMYGSSLDDVIDFYSIYLSQSEIQVMRSQKLYILPPLKSMRKHNAHMKD